MVEAVEQTVGGVEVEEEGCDLKLGPLVEDLEEVEVKGVGVMTCPCLELQALVAMEVEEVGATKQVKQSHHQGPSPRSLAREEVLLKQHPLIQLWRMKHQIKESGVLQAKVNNKVRKGTFHIIPATYLKAEK